MEQAEDVDERAARAEDRRGFFARTAAVGLSTLVALVPGAASLVVFLDPLRRRKRRDGLVKVAPLDMVPQDGLPRRFSILAAREDAWTRLPRHPVGAVYLRREPGADGVEALSAACPHAGCFVYYQEAAGRFRCPCHDSRFERNGERIDPGACPSPRALDALTTEVREQVDEQGRPLLGQDGRPRREVWVHFQNFRAGTPAKIAVE
jgi:nitrite reductase/ring-hydroxylating ferredoxin subunit